MIFTNVLRRCLGALSRDTWSGAKSASAHHCNRSFDHHIVAESQLLLGFATLDHHIVAESQLLPGFTTLDHHIVAESQLLLGFATLDRYVPLNRITSGAMIGSFLPSDAVVGCTEGPPRFRRGKLPLGLRQRIPAEGDAEHSADKWARSDKTPLTSPARVG